MITLVARPFGRGSVLRSYSSRSALLRFTPTRNSAAACIMLAGTRGRSLRAPPLTRSCGCVGVVQRREDALQGVAADAIRQKRLDLVVAGSADQPLRVRELRDWVAAF